MKKNELIIEEDHKKLAKSYSGKLHPHTLFSQEGKKITEKEQEALQGLMKLYDDVHKKMIRK